MQITGGKFNSRQLLSPKGDNVRPTLSKIRSAVFDSLRSFMDFEDKVFLDMFAGSGVMGLEAVSRGFKKSFAIEKDRKTFLNIKHNYELLGVEENVFWGDSVKKLAALNTKFDVIYIDPPYDENLYEPALRAIAKCCALQDGGIVVLEHLEDEIINSESYSVIKQKHYANKVITILGRI